MLYKAEVVLFQAISATVKNAQLRMTKMLEVYQLHEGL